MMSAHTADAVLKEGTMPNVVEKGEGKSKSLWRLSHALEVSRGPCGRSVWELNPGLPRDRRVY